MYNTTSSQKASNWQACALNDTVTRWEWGTMGKGEGTGKVTCPADHPKLTCWPEVKEHFTKPQQQLEANFGMQSQLNKTHIPKVCCFLFKWSVVSETFCVFWNVYLISFHYFASRKPWNLDSSCDYSYRCRPLQTLVLHGNIHHLRPFSKYKQDVIGLPYQP